MTEKVFTGNKNVDLKILSELDDMNLFKICGKDFENKYLHKLCNEETFWVNRSKLNHKNLLKYKKDNETWKKFYIKMVFYKSKMEERKFDKFREILKNYDPEEIYKLLSELLKLYNINQITSFVYMKDPNFLDLFCLNQKVLDLCKDERIWKLMIAIYSPEKINFKPLNETWRQFYSKTF